MKTACTLKHAISTYYHHLWLILPYNYLCKSNPAHIPLTLHSVEICFTLAYMKY